MSKKRQANWMVLAGLALVFAGLLGASGILRLAVTPDTGGGGYSPTTTTSWVSWSTTQWQWTTTTPPSNDAEASGSNVWTYVWIAGVALIAIGVARGKG